MVPLSGPPRLKEAKASQSSSTAPRPVLTYPPSPFLFSKSPSGYYYSCFLFLSHVSLWPFHWAMLFPHSLSLFLFLFFILSLDLWWLLDFWGAELWCIARAVILICSHVAKLSLSYSMPCFFFSAALVTLLQRRKHWFVGLLVHCGLKWNVSTAFEWIRFGTFMTHQEEFELPGFSRGASKD